MIRAHRRQSLRYLCVFVLFNHLGTLTPLAYANPRGGVVVRGGATIDQAKAGLTDIHQFTDKVILNWRSFGNSAGELIRFFQPSASAVALNRVVGLDPSIINGMLTATGRVFLLNPNGILFGKTARVNVGSLVASTLSMKDDDFWRGNDALAPGAGQTLGAVINQGQIDALDGGRVALVAPIVDNQGSISAPRGKVALAAGTNAIVTLDSEGLVNLGVRSGPAGAVVVPRNAVSDLMQEAVNNKHLVDAGSVTVQDGVATLSGAEGLAISEGELHADGTAAHAAGAVRIDSTQTTIEGPGSAVTANGRGAHSSGGTIRVLSQGTALTARSARLEARGGDTGDGGFVEVSGRHVYAQAQADTSAHQGHPGTYLLDPTNLAITDGGDNPSAGPSGYGDNSFASGTLDAATSNIPDSVSVGTINHQLSLGNVDILASNSIGFQNFAPISDGGLGRLLTFEVIAGGTGAIHTNTGASPPGSITAGTIRIENLGSGGINLHNVGVAGGDVVLHAPSVELDGAPAGIGAPGQELLVSNGGLGVVVNGAVDGDMFVKSVSDALTLGALSESAAAGKTLSFQTAGAHDIRIGTGPVSATGNTVFLGSGGGITNASSQVLAGATVTLSAVGGDIGSSPNPILVDNGTAVIALTGTATAGSLFVGSATGDIDVASASQAKVSYNLNAAGAITDSTGATIKAPTIALTAGTTIGQSPHPVLLTNAGAGVAVSAAAAGDVFVASGSDALTVATISSGGTGATVGVSTMGAGHSISLGANAISAPSGTVNLGSSDDIVSIGGNATNPNILGRNIQLQAGVGPGATSGNIGTPSMPILTKASVKLTCDNSPLANQSLVVTDGLVTDVTFKTLNTGTGTDVFSNGVDSPMRLLPGTGGAVFTSAGSPPSYSLVMDNSASSSAVFVDAFSNTGLSPGLILLNGGPINLTANTVNLLGGFVQMQSMGAAITAVSGSVIKAANVFLSAATDVGSLAQPIVIDNGGAGTVVQFTGSATAGSVFASAPASDIDVGGGPAGTSYHLKAVNGSITDVSGATISAPDVALVAGGHIGDPGHHVLTMASTHLGIDTSAGSNGQIDVTDQNGAVPGQITVTTQFSTFAPAGNIQVIANSSGPQTVLDDAGKGGTFGNGTSYPGALTFDNSLGTAPLTIDRLQANSLMVLGQGIAVASQGASAAVADLTLKTVAAGNIALGGPVTATAGTATLTSIGAITDNGSGTVFAPHVVLSAATGVGAPGAPVLVDNHGSGIGLIGSVTGGDLFVSAPTDTVGIAIEGSSGAMRTFNLMAPAGAITDAAGMPISAPHVVLGALRIGDITSKQPVLVDNANSGVGLVGTATGGDLFVEAPTDITGLRLDADGTASATFDLAAPMGAIGDPAGKTIRAPHVVLGAGSAGDIVANKPILVDNGGSGVGLIGTATAGDLFVEAATDATGLTLDADSSASGHFSLAAPLGAIADPAGMKITTAHLLVAATRVGDVAAGNPILVDNANSGVGLLGRATAGDLFVKAPADTAGLALDDNLGATGTLALEAPLGSITDGAAKTLSAPHVSMIANGVGDIALGHPVLVDNANNGVGLAGTATAGDFFVRAATDTTGLLLAQDCGATGRIDLVATKGAITDTALMTLRAPHVLLSATSLGDIAGGHAILVDNANGGVGVAGTATAGDLFVRAQGDSTGILLDGDSSASGVFKLVADAGGIGDAGGHTITATWAILNAGTTVGSSELAPIFTAVGAVSGSSGFGGFFASNNQSEAIKGITANGDVALTATAGDLSQGPGFIAGNNLTLAATSGAVGAPGPAWIQTRVNALTGTAGGGGFFVNNSQSLTLNGISASGDAEVIAGPGSLIQGVASPIAAVNLTLSAADAVGAAGSGRILTAVTTLKGQAGTGGYFASNDGALTLDGISAATDAELVATTGSLLQGTGRVSAQNLTLGATAGSVGKAGLGNGIVTQADSLTATAGNGGINIASQGPLTAGGAVTLASISASGAGHDVVVLNAAGDLVVDSVSTPGNTATLVTPDAIRDGGGSIVANQVDLSAGTGVGSVASPMGLAASAVSAGNSGTGEIGLVNNSADTAALDLTLGDAIGDIKTAGGAIKITSTDGMLTVATGHVVQATGGTATLLTLAGNGHSAAPDIVLDGGVSAIGDTAAVDSANDVSGPGTITAATISLKAAGKIASSGLLTGTTQIDLGAGGGIGTLSAPLVLLTPTVSAHSTGSGAICLTNNAADTAALDLTLGDSVDGVLTANGPIKVTNTDGTLTVGASSLLQAVGGDATLLTVAGTHGGTSDIVLDGGVTAAGNTATLQSAHDITGPSIITAATISLTAAGKITISGLLTGTTQVDLAAADGIGTLTTPLTLATSVISASNAGSGDIALSNSMAGNVALGDLLGNVTASNGAIQIINTGGNLTVATGHKVEADSLTAANTVALETLGSGDVILDGSVNAPGNRVLLSSAGNISGSGLLSAQSGLLEALAAIGSMGAPVQTHVSTLTLQNGSTGDAFAANDGALVVDTGGATIQGALGIASSNGDLTVGPGNVAATGDITLATLTANAVKVDGGVTAGGNVILTAGAEGSVTGDSSGIIVASGGAGTLTVTSHGGIALDAAANQVNAGAIRFANDTAGNVDIGNTGTASLHGSSSVAGGTITVHATNGDLTVDGPVGSAGSGADVTLETLSSGHILVDGPVTSGGNVILTAAPGGSIGDNTLGLITANGGGIAAGTITLTAHGGIALDTVANQTKAATIAFTNDSAGNVDIGHTGALLLSGSSSSGGTVTLNNTGGALTLNGALSTTGGGADITLKTLTSGSIVVDAPLSAGGNVALTAAPGGTIGDSSSGIITANGGGTGAGAITLTAHGGIALDTVANQTNAAAISFSNDTAGNVDIGNTGTATVHGTSGVLGGTVTLKNTGGDLAVNGLLGSTGSGADISLKTLTSGNILVDGPVTSGGNVILVAAPGGSIGDNTSGIITANGGGGAAGTITLISHGGIALDTVANQTKSATIAFANDSAGSVDIGHTGAVNFSGANSFSGGTIMLNNTGGNITINGMLGSTGNGADITLTTLTAGNITVGGGVTAGGKASFSAAGSLANAGTFTITASTLLLASGTGIGAPGLPILVDGGGAGTAVGLTATAGGGSLLVSAPASTIDIGGNSSAKVAFNLNAALGAITDSGGWTIATPAGGTVVLAAATGVGTNTARVKTSTSNLRLENSGANGAFADNLPANALLVDTGGTTVQGDLTVTNANANLTIGTLKVAATGTITLQTITSGSILTAGGVSTSRSLVLLSAGNITGTGTLTARDATASAAGAITLGGIAVGTLSATASGGNVNLASVGDLTLSLLQASGTATLSSAGAISALNPLNTFTALTVSPGGTARSNISVPTALSGLVTVANAPPPGHVFVNHFLTAAAATSTSNSALLNRLLLGLQKLAQVANAKLKAQKAVTTQQTKPIVLTKPIPLTKRTR